jgi:hypothetical protein
MDKCYIKTLLLHTNGIQMNLCSTCMLALHVNNKYTCTCMYIHVYLCMTNGVIDLVVLAM